METYQRLVVYRQQHNNTNVPGRYKEDPKLGTWVKDQRTAYRIKNMLEERVSCLNSIGFEWSLKVKRSRSSSLAGTSSPAVAGSWNI
mmetsp:Transcript_52131/g.53123  ORF Transcript_52131/g.53123 Transcript_52131/m.53123 type:complete len:87 (-) Transcript_52131:170-430(-)